MCCECYNITKVQSKFIFDRCLESLGEWDQLNEVAASYWKDFPKSGQVKMSSFAAAAAWRLKQWHQMTNYVEHIPRDTMDGAFYRAVLCVHEEQFEKAQKVLCASQSNKNYNFYNYTSYDFQTR